MNLTKPNDVLDQAHEHRKSDASDPDIQRRARQKMVDIVSAISAFEGGEPSTFYRAEREKFVNGEIGADELHDRVVMYWRRQDP